MWYDCTMQTQTPSPIQPTSTRSHIQVTPGVCGGKPRIAGTRIRVQDVVIWHERLNLSADEIVSEYPQVSLSSVYAALAYYYDHQSEIDQQMAQGLVLVEELKQNYPFKIPTKSIGDIA